LNINGNRNSFWHHIIRPQTDFIIDINGKTIDCIIRFEDLINGLNIVWDKIGIAYQDKNFPHIGKS